MAKWFFKTAALNARNSSRHLWYWQIDSDTTVIFTGIRLFATLADCVADARTQGFRGMLNVPNDIAHPVVVTCTEDASGACVTTIDKQAA